VGIQGLEQCMYHLYYFWMKAWKDIADEKKKEKV